MDGFEMMHKAWRSIEEMAFCFPRSSTKFQGHIQFDFADGFEMMHEAYVL